DKPEVRGTLPDSEEEVVRSVDAGAPLAALAFKVVTDPFVGKLTFVRIYSGTLRKGNHILNSTKGQRERVGRIVKLHANIREVNVGAPQVAYRETITQAAHGTGRFVRQTGGRGQYGHVELEVEPNEAGKGFEFVSRIVGGTIPKEYVPAVGKGIQNTLVNGVLAAFPVVDVKVTLVDGSYHDVDSNEMAFSIAGSMGFKDGMRKAKPCI